MKLDVVVDPGPAAVAQHERTRAGKAVSERWSRLATRPWVHPTWRPGPTGVPTPRASLLQTTPTT